MNPTVLITEFLKRVLRDEKKKKTVCPKSPSECSDRNQ